MLPAFGFSLAARLAARRPWMLRGAGKRGGRLTRRVAEEFLAIAKIGWRSIVPDFEFERLKSIRILAAYSSIGPQTENQAWGKKRCAKSLGGWGRGVFKL